MSRPEVAAFRAVVRGRVQGVGFRDYVAMRARALGLGGYIRNLPDGGSVEVVAEGPRDALDRLSQQLNDGPRSSRVDGVNVDWLPPTGDRRAFEIRF
jgi:acylphosphatase